MSDNDTIYKSNTYMLNVNEILSLNERTRNKSSLHQFNFIANLQCQSFHPVSQ